MAKMVGGKRYLSAVWYYVASRQKRSVYFSLGTSWTDACRKADQLRAYLTATHNDVEAARTWFERKAAAGSPIPGGNLPQFSTIGDVLSLLAEQSLGMGLTKGSLYSYEKSLIRLVRIALLQRTGKTLSDDEVLAQSCGLLNDRLVSDYKLKMTRGVLSELKLRSAQRTASSVLRCAKAVFSAEARKKYRSAKLALPDLTEFLEASGFKGVGVDYALPTSELMLKVLSQIEGHDASFDDNMWIGAYLAFKAGLRRNEIAHATWEWLHCDGKPFIAIRRTDEFRPKGRPRDVPLSREVYERLLSKKSPGATYLIAGSADERREEWSRRLNARLRELGMKMNKPTHELRKWYGSYVAVTEGLTMAQARLGHTSHQLTYDYYADLQFPQSLKRFWADSTSASSESAA